MRRNDASVQVASLYVPDLLVVLVQRLGLGGEESKVFLTWSGLLPNFSSFFWKALNFSSTIRKSALAAKPAAGVAGGSLRVMNSSRTLLVGGLRRRVLSLVVFSAITACFMYAWTTYSPAAGCLSNFLMKSLRQATACADVLGLLVGAAGEEVGLRAVLRLVGDRLRVALVEVGGASRTAGRCPAATPPDRAPPCGARTAANFGILRDCQVALDRLVELEEAVVVARGVPQRFLAPLGIGVVAVEALVALGRFAELEQLFVDDAGVVERRGRAGILGVGVDDVDQVQRQTRRPARSTILAWARPWRPGVSAGRWLGGGAMPVTMAMPPGPVTADGQLLVGPLLLVLHRRAAGAW